MGDNSPWASHVSAHLTQQGTDCPLFQTICASVFIKQPSNREMASLSRAKSSFAYHFRRYRVSLQDKGQTVTAHHKRFGSPKLRVLFPSYSSSHLGPFASPLYDLGTRGTNMQICWCSHSFLCHK